MHSKVPIQGQLSRLRKRMILFSLVAFLPWCSVTALHIEPEKLYVALTQTGIDLSFEELAPNWAYPQLDYQIGAAQLILTRLVPKMSWWRRWFWWPSYHMERFEVFRLFDDLNVPEIDLVARASIGGGFANRVSPAVSVAKLRITQIRLSGKILREFIRKNNLEIGEVLLLDSELAVTAINMPFDIQPGRYREKLVPRSARPVGFRIRIIKQIYTSILQPVSSVPLSGTQGHVKIPDFIATDHPVYTTRHEPRSVFLAIYPFPFDTPSLRKNVVANYFVKHHEVHIGNTAFCLGHGERIQYRPVSESKRVYGIPISQLWYMCDTTKSDNDILTYMYRNMRGPYCFIDKGCHDFSEMVVEYACEDGLGMIEGVNDVLKLPPSYRHALKALRKWPVKTLIPKKYRNHIDPAPVENSDEVEEFVKKVVK